MNGPDHRLSSIPSPARLQTRVNPKRIPRLGGGAALAASLLLGSAFVAQAEIKFYPDVVMIQYYENIGGGTTIPALTGNPKFPNSPDRVVFAAMPEIPVNAGDNYGVRITGVLNPPYTEAFYLIICSDDQGELHLSPDTNAANKVLVAREPVWNNSRAWSTPDRRPETEKIDPAQPAPNVSVPLVFTLGEPRYFELLMKEGTGGDNLAMTINPELSVTPAPPDGTEPSLAGFTLGVWADDVPRVLSGPVLKGVNKSAVAGQPTTFTASYYAPPGTITLYQWFRNGVPIVGATGPEYTFTPAAGDAGANYRVQVTVDGKASAPSSDVTLRLDTFSPGFAKIEFFYAIGGTSVGALTSAQKFIDNTPDEVRFVTAAATPTDFANDYGARLSFMVIPQQSGDYRFFIRSDDASQLYLSTDGTVTNLATATLLAEETGCCNAFTEPESPRTSGIQSLTAGETNVMFGLVKEGGGGDFLHIAMRREGDTTPASGLRPIAGSLIGVMANGTGIGLTVAQNPQSTNAVEGRTVIFEARGVATPTGTPVAYQWQRNGVDVPGASGSRLTVSNVTVTADNNTTYRAIIGTIGGIQQTSSVATLTVVPDTFPPQPRVAALGTASGEVEISVTWDELVMDEDASNQVNYSVSPGTISSFTYWPHDQGAVLGLSGVPPSGTVQVRVNNVRDTKGNRITAPVSRSVTLTNLLSWTGIGGDTLNGTRSTDAFSDGTVALGTKDFDLISGGDAYWVNYDEATFVYEQVTGDFDRAVRVEHQDPSSQWARAGLQVREALDTGVTREQVTAGYKMSQNFTVRVNPTAQCNGGVGNNSYEVLHRPIEGRNYDGFPAMFNIQAAFGGAPNYPTAWMRVRRVGQTIEAYKSDDGITWVGPASTTYTNDPATVDEDESLAATVYVGMFYGPELANNTPMAADCTLGSTIAKFRDYGPFGGGGGAPTISIARPGVVTYSGRLQSSPTLTPPQWSDVTAASSPYTIPAGTNMRFYRTVSP